MNWIEYYLPKVNNLECENKFLNKYDPFLDLIKNILKNKYPINVVELGCGTGIITKLLLKYASCLVLGDKNFILTDVSDSMLNLTRLNMRELETQTQIADRRLKNLQYIQHDILDTHTLEYESYKKGFNADIFITHGVLEHFSQEVVEQILININEDTRVIGHIHYVPTDEYTTKSFGDENL